MRSTCLVIITLGFALPAALPAADCSGLPDAGQLRTFLNRAPNQGGDAGGLFHGKREWGVLVNRQGEICVVITSTSDPTQVWPGSEAIAKSKAFTANAFSLDSLPMSTTRLYTLTQPGHSLYGTPFAAPFVTTALADQPGNGALHPEGGLIAYGGGVPLYKNGKVIGALGVSGDTSCADHEVAKRVRAMAGLNPPGGPAADDILFTNVDGPSIYEQPLCPNTWRNGKFIGNEAVAGLTYTTRAGHPARATASRANRIRVAKKPH
jgi:uncharacterized protein GlcG (DUF336 family)